MATSTQPRKKYTDHYGIERSRANEPGALDKAREKSSVFDHIMRMQDRFASEGGNQFSAGITYFSVMAIFPLTMLTFAVLAMALAARPDMLADIQNQISSGLPQDIAGLVNQIIDQAIEQRGTVAGIGALTALWSGLGWMGNLRAGVSAMWLIDPTEGGNFVMKKLADLVALIGLLIALVFAFGVTAIGTSGLTDPILNFLGIESFPGLRAIIFVLGLVIGVFANFLVFAWMLMALPRTKVPRRSGFKAALIGAIIFEVIKQLSTVIFGALLGNPAGAVFGPIIGLMLIMYLVWRVVMYLSAFAATTRESLEATPTQAPDPAVIHVRNSVRTAPRTSTTLGVGAALGAVATAVITLLK
ncbi:YhjD/YihY/BrkB family envelope integrity protein [Corynebacterium tapiri]|uniref:Inner membrane protein YhjD n=1 Tax=Corynebacterium tapiri TaxID=1448266 RepID=A0A5C4U4G9_9CORY|nr:YhjD/YihY/BrkB family envelope integrity protein [Corynebacterium tapiri]TNL98461.1 inner membrane protein YhjD [Corynebacterium tapiri]